ncbi:hypothetical protein ACYZTX_01200 [Pseudomonas sp. MDT1-17]
MPRLYKLALTLLLTALVNQTVQATVVKDETPWPLAQSFGSKTLSVIPVEKRPIFIFAFIHDDVPESKIPSIYPDHFLPVIKEIRSTMGRDVSVIFIRNAPPYTNYAYRGKNQASYDGWKDLGINYRETNNLPVGRTTKFMLLTKEWMNSETLGLAGMGQQFALATLNSKQIVGHELGHMLDAEHEFSEVRYNGWWCETFMAAKVNPLLSNCYVFTDPNRARISNYLSRVP